MGCLCAKSNSETSENKNKLYSWDKRDEVNIKDYCFQDVVDTEVWKAPGTVNGQQFYIQNCKRANIYIFDYVDSVTIDDCISCKIILGAVKGSVYIRDCKDCLCVAACGQFRARDCRKLDAFLCCATQPIIESSSSVHFGCYQLSYKGIEDHFCEAGLSIYNNEWSNIHDFTSLEGESNWCLLPDTIKIEDYVSLPKSEELKCLNMSVSGEESIVPYTWGPYKPPIGQVCFVAFFCDGQQVQRSNAFINRIRMENPDILLLLSRDAELTEIDAQKVFKITSYTSAALRGRVIGLQFCGTGCIETCQKVARSIATATGSTDLVYVSNNPEQIQQQINNFFKCSSEQFNV